MKFDVIIFEGDGLDDYSKPDTPTLKLSNVSYDEVLLLSKLVYQQETDLFICCLPDMSEG